MNTDTANKQAISDHFVEVLEMVLIDSGVKRKLPDVRLSHYGCYPEESQE